MVEVLRLFPLLTWWLPPSQTKTQKKKKSKEKTLKKKYTLKERQRKREKERERIIILIKEITTSLMVVTVVVVDTRVSGCRPWSVHVPLSARSRKNVGKRPGSRQKRLGHILWIVPIAFYRSTLLIWSEDIDRIWCWLSISFFFFCLSPSFYFFPLPYRKLIMAGVGGGVKENMYKLGDLNFPERLLL